METVSPEVKKYQIYAHYIKLSGGTEGFLSEDRRRLLPVPEKDFYLTINLHRTHNVNGYIDIQRPEEVFTVIRQQFNPFYIEYGFFNSVDRIKASEGGDFTDTQREFAISRRPDVFTSSPTLQEFIDWYNTVGKYELPWNEGTEFETSLHDIEESDLTTQSVISKAKFFPITINR
jgi:hypothetical protein